MRVRARRGGGRLGLLLGGLVVALSMGCAGGEAVPPGLDEGVYAALETEKGTILLELAYDEAPMTVMNFVGLAEGFLDAAADKPFYDGLTFHRVEEELVIQGGDPTGSGTGGPGYIIPDEFSQNLSHGVAGVVSMANVGPDTNGSQFFLTMAPMPFLDGKHSVFGRIVEGMDVVRSIKPGDTIEEVGIYRVGAQAKAFEASQEAFDRLVEGAWEESDRRRKAAAEVVAREIRRVVEGVETTESGLMYKVIVPGDGPRPQEGQEVAVRFTAMFLDGTVFESSYQRGGGPSLFKIGSGIKAWNEALPQMQRGETRVLFVPPELGYGRLGHAEVIPPDSFLVFEIELVDF